MTTTPTGNMFLIDIIIPPSKGIQYSLIGSRTYMPTSANADYDILIGERDRTAMLIHLNQNLKVKYEENELGAIKFKIHFAPAPRFTQEAANYFEINLCFVTEADFAPWVEATRMMKVLYDTNLSPMKTLFNHKPDRMKLFADLVVEFGGSRPELLKSSF